MLVTPLCTPTTAQHNPPRPRPPGGYFQDPEGERTTDPAQDSLSNDNFYEYVLIPRSNTIPYTLTSLTPLLRTHRYDEETSFLLSDQYALLETGKLKEAAHSDATQLLDLSMFTNLPSTIWKGREVVMRNPRAPAHLAGKATVAGFDAGFWARAAALPELLPLPYANDVAMGFARVVGPFYQVASGCIAALAEHVAYLSDPTGVAPAVPPDTLRKRLVCMVEYVPGWRDLSEPPTQQQEEEEEEKKLPVADGIPVYEWWFGERGVEGELGGVRPRGYWQRYHPTVCRRLEQAWQSRTHTHTRAHSQTHIHNTQIDACLLVFRRSLFFIF